MRGAASVAVPVFRKHPWGRCQRCHPLQCVPESGVYNVFIRCRKKVTVNGQSQCIYK